MLLSQMFPSKKLDGEDLNAAHPGLVTCTIERIDVTGYDSRDDDDEVFFLLKVREFKKPFNLSKTRGQAIKEVMDHHGCERPDDTDQWIGRTINIYGEQISIYDRAAKKNVKLWVVNIDPHKPTGPATLPPNQDITGSAYTKLQAGKQNQGLPGNVTAAIGKTTAALIIAALRQRGKTWDDLVAHFKMVRMGEVVSGKMPYDCPASISTVARSFVGNLPKTTDVDVQAVAKQIEASWEPKAEEKIDSITGEVIPSDEIPF